ncbi:MAG: hypothetical protein ACR65O_08790 [Methylomicrobium sp.]
MPLSEFFGFLKYPYAIEFVGGSIEPTDSFQDGLKYIKERKNRDGYLYPPQVISFIQPMDFESGEFGKPQAIPNSNKPSSVFSLPASHILFINSPLNNKI